MTIWDQPFFVHKIGVFVHMSKLKVGLHIHLCWQLVPILAFLDDSPVWHVVVSTYWIVFSHVDVLAVALGELRHGVS